MSKSRMFLTENLNWAFFFFIASTRNESRAKHVHTDTEWPPLPTWFTRYPSRRVREALVHHPWSSLAAVQSVPVQSGDKTMMGHLRNYPWSQQKFYYRGQTVAHLVKHTCYHAQGPAPYLQRSFKNSEASTTAGMSFSLPVSPFLLNFSVLLNKEKNFY